MSSSSIRKLGISAAACLLAVAAVAPAAAQKMKAEEVIAKHLESVGPAAARAAVKNRVALGTVVITFREPAGQLSGVAVLSSQGEKSLIGMSFDNPSYPHEKVGFDGKDVSVSFVRPGRRSTFGDFLMQHRSIIKQGLVGGTLSDAWPLFRAAEEKAKIEYSGLKKVGDRQAHALKYLPRGGSDMNVILFFDAETFRHVRTEYTRTLAAQMGATPEASARQRESRYKLVEDFTDFRPENGLTLPHKYRVTLEMMLPGGSYKLEMDMDFQQFAFNQDIDPNSFDVDGE
ncbi:MAG TPA: hypothetical protein VK421_09200 [Pyrinomonadaceae bacterium]|nr:hypothetical protein [Pyrinomonadaceae bacterium]